MLKIGDKVKIKSAENTGFELSDTLRIRRDYFDKTTFITGFLYTGYTLNISGKNMMWSATRFDKVEN